MTVRRAVGVAVGAAAIAACSGGCAIDLPTPAMNLANGSDQDVVVIVEDSSGEYRQLVHRRNRETYSASECSGTGIRVETASGDLLGRVDAQACPDWTLTIHEDGSLDYAEDK